MDFPSIKGERKLRGRALCTSGIAALMQVCLASPTLQDARDAALIAILRGAGLRRAELVNLDLKDFTASGGKLEVREGKGDSYRTVYLPSSAIAIVEDWLELSGFALLSAAVSDS